MDTHAVHTDLGFNNAAPAKGAPRYGEAAKRQDRQHSAHYADQIRITGTERCTAHTGRTAHRTDSGRSRKARTGAGIRCLRMKTLDHITPLKPHWRIWRADIHSPRPAASTPPPANCPKHLPNGRGRSDRALPSAAGKHLATYGCPLVQPSGAKPIHLPDQKTERTTRSPDKARSGRAMSRVAARSGLSSSRGILIWWLGRLRGDNLRWQISVRIGLHPRNQAFRNLQSAAAATLHPEIKPTVADSLACHRRRSDATRGGKAFDFCYEIISCHGKHKGLLSRPCQGTFVAYPDLDLWDRKRP